MAVQAFRELRVWREAHALVLAVYRETEGMPASERYGITSQLRRAAVSVATNIVEGTKRRGDREFARFVNIAEGWCAEAAYLLTVARDLGYLRNIDDLVAAAIRLEKMLCALHDRLMVG